MTLRRVRRHWPLLPLLALCALLYAGGLDAYGMLGWDESEYASIGRSVLRGDGFAISGKPNGLRPPVLPLSIAASIWLNPAGGDVAVRLPNLLFSLLALVVVYVWISDECGRIAALLAAACLGMAPWFWCATPLALAEIPFIVFFTGAVAFLYAGLYRDAGWFAWSAVAAALALLTRYTALLFAPVAVATIGLALVLGDGEVRRRLTSRQFVDAPLWGAAVLAPWLLREHITFGNALAGVARSATQLQVYAPALHMPWYFYFVQLPQMLSPPILAVTLVGVAWAIIGRERLALHCVLVAAVVLLWFSCYRYKEPRLVSSALPFLAVVAAIGLRRSVLPRRPTPLLTAILVALVALMTAGSFRMARPMLDLSVTVGYPAFIDAMRFIEARTGPDAVIVSASVPQTFWYTQRRTVDLPPRAQLAAVLRDVDWVVLTNFDGGQRPYGVELMNLPTSADEAAGDAVRFASGGAHVLLLRAGWLKSHL